MSPAASPRLLIDCVSLSTESLPKGIAAYLLTGIVSYVAVPHPRFVLTYTCGQFDVETDLNSCAAPREHLRRSTPSTNTPPRA